LARNDFFSGTISSATDVVPIAGVASSIAAIDAQSMTAAWVTVYGTHAGVNLAWEGSMDGVVWGSCLGLRTDSTATQTFGNSSTTITANASQQYYVQIGGYRYFRVRASAWTSGVMNVSVMTADGSPPMIPFSPGSTAASSQNDGASNPTVGTTGANQFEFNGTTWDRVRGNASAVAVDLTGARTTSGNGVTATNYDATGAFIQVNVTGAPTGTTPTAVFRVQYSVDGTNFLDLDLTNAVTPSITAAGQYVIKVFPGIPSVAAGSCNSPLPRTWRLAWTIGGGTPSFTFVSHVTYIRG
jgi:hypothetical protein